MHETTGCSFCGDVIYYRGEPEPSMHPCCSFWRGIGASECEGCRVSKLRGRRHA